VLLFYYQAKKPEQLYQIKKWFLDLYKGSEQHDLANASLAFSKALEDQEYHYYFLPGFLKFFETSFQKLSCMWHWKDVLKMRELLLVASIQKYIDFIKEHPTDLETHATLGNAYVELSRLYLDPNAYAETEKWIPPIYASNIGKSKCKASLERAIEEFKIVEHFLPNDLWVHGQLANVYRCLKMPEKEIEEYEIIHGLRPDDVDVLLRLGLLYFEAGQNARGLKIYELLKETAESHARELISHYDAYTHPAFEEEI
jgi:hypothetical protein